VREDLKSSKDHIPQLASRALAALSHWTQALARLEKKGEKPSKEALDKVYEEMRLILDPDEISRQALDKVVEHLKLPKAANGMYDAEVLTKEELQAYLLKGEFNNPILVGPDLHSYVHDLEDRITSVPALFKGAACVRSTQFTVLSVWSHLDRGYSPEELVKHYTCLEMDDIFACLLLRFRHKIRGVREMTEDSGRVENEWVIKRGKSQTECLETKHLTVDYADGLTITNDTDADGNPAGGGVSGTGITIIWQNGPVDREAKEYPDGAFIEDVVHAIILRLEFYQNSKFVCDENAEALDHMRLALSAMLKRRDDRLERGVLGKHEK